MSRNLRHENTDEELMVAYQLGEAEAFEVLYSRYAPKVLGFLRKKLKSEAFALDVFQATFLKLHRSRSRYNSDLPFAPWLFTVCRSELLDALKKPHRTQESLVAETPEPAILEIVETELEGVSFDSLPTNQKKAMELRYRNEFSFEQIAASLDTTPANARQLVSRAIRSLRGLYGK
jgi:RNA polymerase sigma factor (sigma-70 family)